MKNIERKKPGRPYSGGANPEKWHKDKWQRRTPYTTVSIAGRPEEITVLKEKARINGKSLSRYIIDSLLAE